jgi:alkylhydroperoxidase family enzyme
MVRLEVPAEHADNPKGWVDSSFSPDIIAAARGLYLACYANESLSLREFEGARVRMAEINGCVLCQNWRSGGPDAAQMIARVPALAGRTTVADRGPAPDEAFYAAVSQWRDSPLFSERERLAIGYAEGLSLDPQGLAADEELWTRLHAAYADAELVDLSYCCFSWFQGRVTHALGLDGVCGYVPA